ncbi:host cell division inhibitor Icd-like protein [Escherichia coli]
MCNALTVTKRESAPLPERLCERIFYCAILLTVYEADYSVVVAQSEGADHRYYSTPEMQNILLQNAVGHVVRKAKKFAGGATDAIFSGRQVLINLMSDFVLDKTKATAEGRQWESTKLERITNNATFVAGGQCDQCAGLLVGYSCSLALRRWRRLISPRMAVTINCAVLSPVSLTCSIASTTSCGARACNFCDLLLIWSLSISGFLCDYWNPVYTKKTKTKYLKWIPLGDYTGIQLSNYHSMQTRLERIAVLSQPLTTNDNESIEVAMRNHTTHPQGRDSHNLNKYIWRFIALSTAQPRVITIEATSEQEARQQSPAGCVMVFAARIRQEVNHG